MGDWWRDRLHCRQWGAHFPHVAGIAGQSGRGAQSVVLSGGCGLLAFVLPAQLIFLALHILPSDACLWCHFRAANACCHGTSHRSMMYPLQRRSFEKQL